MFVHADAQKGELSFAQNVVKEGYKHLLSKIEEARDAGEDFNSFYDWFSNLDQHKAFCDEIRNGHVLEVGCGPFGIVSVNEWIKHRYAIDPLLEEYIEAQLNDAGKTIFENVECKSISAEVLVEEFVGRMDCVVSRNCIDHAQDPWLVFDNITKYSNKWIVFWVEHWHPIFDNMHQNLTQNRDTFLKMVSGFGFEILEDTIFSDKACDNPNIGFVAKKQSSS